MVECPDGKEYSRDPENDCKPKCPEPKACTRDAVLCKATGKMVGRDPYNDCEPKCAEPKACTKDLVKCEATGKMVGRDPYNDCKPKCRDSDDDMDKQCSQVKGCKSCFDKMVYRDHSPGGRLGWFDEGEKSCIWMRGKGRE